MKEIIPKKFTITKIKKKYFYHLKKIYNQELANKLIFTIFIFWKNNFNLILNVIYMLHIIKLLWTISLKIIYTKYK